MRPTSSCSICRSRKKKCIPRRPGKTCEFCERTGLSCDLGKAAACRVTRRRLVSKFRDQLRPQGSESCDFSSDSDVALSRADHLPKQSVCDELVDQYFDMIHDKQHILFHRPSFVVNQRAGLVASYLVLGIIALVARFSSNPYFKNIEPRARARVFLQRAIKSFNSRSELISISAIQGSILLGFVAFVEGDKEQDALLSAQAVRMVQFLRLPERRVADPIQSEVEIRVFWQTWMMDTWSSARDQVTRQLKSDHRYPRPLEECYFESMTPEISLSTDEDGRRLREIGLWSNILPLTELHELIVQLNDKTMHQHTSLPNIKSEVRVLARVLDEWLRDLPAHLQNNPENFEAFVRSGRGREFTVLHLLYHHQSQLLYYQFLDKTATPADADGDQESLRFTARCKAHAMALSDLMWETNRRAGMECLWSPVNGHLLVVASTVHLHSLLLDVDSTENARTKKRLEQNFTMLLQFQQYWPSLDNSMSRLQAFHRACLANNVHDNFDMDGWMAGFLNRYDLPVGDRHAEKAGVSGREPLPLNPVTAAELWREGSKHTMAIEGRVS